MTSSNADNIAIIGCGEIGLAMAAVFANSGFAVFVADPSEAAREDAPKRLREYFHEMVAAGMMASPGAESNAKRIRIASELESDSSSTAMALECGPECVETKRILFENLRSWGGTGLKIATTSSAIPVSAIVPREEDRANCIVAHCANPPTLIRVIEIVPAHGTQESSVEFISDLLASAGFLPVRLRSEIEGFAFNRLQSALLREAYRLVEDGIADVDGIDRLVSDGLGLRWALSGPFETADLNTPGGISAHAKRLGPAYKRIGEEIGEKRPGWSEALVAEVERQCRAKVSENERPSRVKWRRRSLAKIIAARKSADSAWDRMAGR